MLDTRHNLLWLYLHIIRVYDLCSTVRLLPSLELGKRLEEHTTEPVLDFGCLQQHLSGRMMRQQVSFIRWVSVSTKSWRCQKHTRISNSIAPGSDGIRFCDLPGVS